MTGHLYTILLSMGQTKGIEEKYRRNKSQAQIEKESGPTEMLDIFPIPNAPYPLRTHFPS